MSGRKLLAKSFLSILNAIVSCRTGNDSRKISCPLEMQSSHAGQETIRARFPARMKGNRVMWDGNMLKYKKYLKVLGTKEM
jgi:hypothetical protein